MSPQREAAIRVAVEQLVGLLLVAVQEAAPVQGAPDRLLSVDEVAEALNLGRSAVYLELAAGRIRSIKVGRRRLIPAAALAEFVAAQAGR